MVIDGLRLVSTRGRRLRLGDVVVAIVGETAPTNPLTTYAKANEMAENGVLPLADDDFCVVVLRQATVYGYSPRMRFDLDTRSPTGKFVQIARAVQLAGRPG